MDTASIEMDKLEMRFLDLATNAGTVHCSIGRIRPVVPITNSGGGKRYSRDCQILSSPALAVTVVGDEHGKTRVSIIEVAGMGHAWPAGAGGQNANYVDGTRVAYRECLAEFFFNNNLRVNRDPAPTLNSCVATVASDEPTVTVTGTATDNGTVKNYTVALLGPTRVDDTLPGGASLSKQYTALAEGFYSSTVTATDNRDQPSEACNLTSFVIGNPPPIAAPTNVRVTASTSDAITLTWDPSDGATGYPCFEARPGLPLHPSPNRLS